MKTEQSITTVISDLKKKRSYLVTDAAKRDLFTMITTLSWALEANNDLDRLSWLIDGVEEIHKQIEKGTL